MASCYTSVAFPPYIILSFFFQPYADHRDLHSFPTRRSSDLHVAHRPERSEAPILGKGPLQPLDGGVRRSEEHTSELQSRFDLVCRLLLEKKKNNTGKLCMSVIVHPPALRLRRFTLPPLDATS